MKPPWHRCCIMRHIESTLKEFKPLISLMHFRLKTNMWKTYPKSICELCQIFNYNPWGQETKTDSSYNKATLFAVRNKPKHVQWLSNDICLFLIGKKFQIDNLSSRWWFRTQFHCILLSILFIVSSSNIIIFIYIKWLGSKRVENISFIRISI